jgi:hypothetical protein
MWGGFSRAVRLKGESMVPAIVLNTGAEYVRVWGGSGGAHRNNGWR